jgi:hypothetical protein
MTSHATAIALGLDFGTTNTVVALADGQGGSELVKYAGDDATGEVFRSALCFWEEERAWQGVAHEAGPWAIAEYLQSPLDSRFVQSFKSVAASASFERALIFHKPFRFEDMGRLFLQRLVAHAGGRLDTLPQRVIVGRPVEYAGARPDPVLARQRYDAMLAAFGTEIIYVHEPLGAAHSYAARLTEPASWSPISAAAPPISRSSASPRPARLDAACRWRHRGSALRVTGSITASLIVWFCPCLAKADCIARSTSCSKFRAAISAISPTGRGWR